MDDLLITSDGRRQLEALTSSPPHALLLVGPTGLGKFTVAHAWAEKLTAPAYITVVGPDEKGTLTIEAVRGLYRLTRSRQEERQVVIIDHAETMGIEAQNAFLKLLEEPRAGVTFVLTAPTEDALLPTISSRTQSVALQRVGQATLQKFALGKTPVLDKQELAQLLFVADGRPAVVAQLLDNPETFEHHKQLMQQAKKLLTASRYERLASIGTIGKSREDAMQVLEAMARMLHAQLLLRPNDGLAELADGIQLTLARLAQNGNARAQLTALFAS